MNALIPRAFASIFPDFCQGCIRLSLQQMGLPADRGCTGGAFDRAWRRCGNEMWFYGILK
jgi:hypothetical protein